MILHRTVDNLIHKILNWRTMEKLHPLESKNLTDVFELLQMANDSEHVLDFAKMKEMMVSDFTRKLLTFGSPLSVLLIVVYSLAFLCGAIGNLLVMIVVLRHKHMRTVTNTFLVNLAAGDLIVVVVCFPFSLAPYIYRQWIYGNVMCKLTPFIQGTSVCVSVLTLLSISFDRFLAIYQPLKARLIFSRKRVKILLFSIWLVSMLTTAPLLYVNGIEITNVAGLTTVTTCEENWRSVHTKQVYNIIIFTLLYAIPLTCMVLTYLRVARTLWHHNDDLFKLSTNHRRQEQLQTMLMGRRRILRMLIVLVSFFAVSWIPYHTINIYLDFNQNHPHIGTLALYVYPIAQLVALSSSAVNPIFYCFLSKSFRDAFTQTCLKWPCFFILREFYSNSDNGSFSRRSWNSRFSRGKLSANSGGSSRRYGDPAMTSNRKYRFTGGSPEMHTRIAILEDAHVPQPIIMYETVV